MAQLAETCLTGNQVRDFLLGRLDAAESGSIEQHLTDCEACRRRVERNNASDSFVDLIREAYAAPHEPEAAREGTQFWDRQIPGRSHDRRRPNANPPSQDDNASAADRDGTLPAISRHYTLTDEIGRGGMGIVYRAVDTRIGREVALKVLGDHVRNADDRRRLVVEARVTGQLQHPGIPPVFELGLDQRPAFIAMKLVHGRTLAELLDERRSADDDQARFISVFEQVCQTVAFAHSRGIIHRDLKPSNIMVGEFGEVQVMDWGIAKSIRPPDQDAAATTIDGSGETATSHHPGSQPTCGGNGHSDNGTTAGVVLGTPAWMPPEQASGRPGETDKRSDVFSLGAILCVILTDKPPYTGNRIRDVLQRVETADLQDAHSRLRSSSGETPLIELAIQCLQASPDDRPDNAGALAAVVTSHLASVRERLRTAELEHARIQATAAEEQKRRRVQHALFASVSALIVLVSTGWAVVTRRNADRETAVRARISETLGEARQLRTRALAEPLDDEEHWSAAEAFVRRAAELCSEVDDPNLESRVRELVARIDTESTAAAFDRALVEQLTDLMDVPLDPSGADSPHGIGGPEFARLTLYHSADDVSARRPPGVRPGARRQPLDSEDLELWRDLHDLLRVRERIQEAAVRVDAGPQPDVPRQSDRTPPASPAIPGSLGEYRSVSGLDDGAEWYDRIGTHRLIDRTALFQFDSALSDYGLDPDFVDPDEAAEILLNRPKSVQTLTAHAFDWWISGLFRYPNVENRERRIAWILQVLARIDGDPERARIRQALAKGDAGFLADWSRGENAIEHPPEFLWLVAPGIGHLSLPRTLSFLRRAQRRHPDSHLIARALAEGYTRRGSFSDAVECLIAAIAARPAASLCGQAGRLLLRVNRADEAIIILKTGVRLRKDYLSAYVDLALLMIKFDRLPDALQMLETALQEVPGDHASLWCVDVLHGEVLERLERDAEAAGAYRRGLERANLPRHARLELDARLQLLEFVMVE